MKKDRKLIRDGKFNRTGIMNQAWSFVRHYGYSLGVALSEAWQAAKDKMKEHKWHERVAEAQKTVNKDSSYNPYNNPSIPASAFYSSRIGAMGAHYVGD